MSQLNDVSMEKVRSLLKVMFTSWKITLVLLIHYMILLAAATFVEKSQGTAMAREVIYNNPLFYLLQLLLVLNFCAIAWQGACGSNASMEYCSCIFLSS